MIDLHMHTKHSDGTDSVSEILMNAEKVKLEVISITDHNSVKAYLEMDKFDWHDYYQGDIVTGCEFTTAYKDRLIEVLGYGFDYHIIDEYLKKYYSEEIIDENARFLYKRLMRKIKEYGLIGNFIDRSNDFFDSEFFERDVYTELAKYPQNKDILGEDIFGSLSDFFRNGLTNVNSKMYMNYPDFKPPLEEIIEIIHAAGGKVFLAHPYQYKFDDTEMFIGRIYDEYDFDGIECYYTTFTDYQTNFLIDFAARRGLLISGGSDYHGANKVNHNLGIGSGNLRISRDILNDFKVNFYN